MRTTTSLRTPPSATTTCHGLIPEKVDIASYLCNVGDVITLKEESPLKVVKESFEGKPTVPAYVTVDAEKFAGTFARLPERNELPKDINEAMIIEYYNRLL